MEENLTRLEEAKVALALAAGLSGVLKNLLDKFQADFARLSKLADEYLEKADRLLENEEG